MQSGHVGLSPSFIAMAPVSGFPPGSWRRTVVCLLSFSLAYVGEAMPSSVDILVCFRTIVISPVEVV